MGNYREETGLITADLETSGVDDIYNPTTEQREAKVIIMHRKLLTDIILSGFNIKRLKKGP